MARPAAKRARLIRRWPGPPGAILVSAGAAGGVAAAEEAGEGAGWVGDTDGTRASTRVADAPVLAGGMDRT
ncbi:hypothetical protein Sgou_46820 [Streptomyces gougerotii]|uniref:Uncharacterized protein n=1 Tax=Streptomyces gougerotii TaxID=53448 RepID=A0A8H9LJU4_9ACTN|nr:hypothetical protein Sgou_46820 [Streptomyces gougerotii]GGU36337.1 hypothetical protein GCM10015534_43610 [Streptomyces diastaticus subsp. diastaticus]GGU64214.1 hypothetical protein GCM10010227_17300 [Streptomyces gougerotii]